jgi:diaminohydroxyphosphoribosylaminopyrimidine deaminase/5-amino-6-(5-phosphoribosylamino)uracil reductase
MAPVTDHELMQRALELAQAGRYTVSPNPMVGCVIVREGAIVAEGFHRRAGEAHAEVVALNGTDARGATMVVTLEPCSHQGRTPPCVDAVIAAGIARVVVAMEDPHDVVNGRGIAALRAAGIEVTVGVLEGEARRLNEKFIWAVSQRLPFVLVKAGMTLDGKLATVARESQWITSEAAREASLRLREEFDAIVVGGGTVKSDDPRLTRRLGLAGEATRWTRVVLDGDGDVPPQAQILNDGGNTILFTASPARYAASPNLEIVATDGRVDLERVFGELHARGMGSVIVEGGALVHSEVIRRGLWQKMILFIAPLLVGGAEAPSIFSGEGVPRLTDAYRFRFDQVERLGGDLMVVAYPA